MAEAPPSARGLAKAAASVQRRRSQKFAGVKRKKPSATTGGFFEQRRVGKTALGAVRYSYLSYCGCASPPSNPRGP
jgi:hypothetical protein